MIAFDLDGVIVDTYEVMRKRLLEKFGVNFPKETHTSFNFDIPDVDPKEIQKCIDDIMVHDTISAKPLGNSIEVLKKIYYDYNLPIVIITARPHISKDNTVAWLKRYLEDTPFKLFVTQNGKKNFYIAVNNIRFFVDDRYKTCHEVSPIVEKVFLFDSPWNQRTIKEKNIIRIKKLNEVFKYIKN